MGFIPSFPVGATVTHQELCLEFKCGNMGGMRRSHVTNTLVIISDHTKALYDDKLYGNELHYTGMGKSGDQTLTSQNRTLAESDTNGIDVHLFEVLKPTQYMVSLSCVELRIRKLKTAIMAFRERFGCFH